MLRALRNIFNALRAPREDLPESLPPGVGGPATKAPALANGAHIDTPVPELIPLHQPSSVSKLPTLADTPALRRHMQGSGATCVHWFFEALLIDRAFHGAQSTGVKWTAV